MKKVLMTAMLAMGLFAATSKADELIWVGKGTIPNGQLDDVNAVVNKKTWASGGEGSIFVSKEEHVFLLIRKDSPRGFGFFDGEYPIFTDAKVELVGLDKPVHEARLPAKGDKGYSWFVSTKPAPKAEEIAKAKEVFKAVAKAYKIEVSDEDLIDTPAVVTEKKAE